MLEVGDGVFEVLSTSGDTHLGGDDFDKVGIDHGGECYNIFNYQWVISYELSVLELRC